MNWWVVMSDRPRHFADRVARTFILMEVLLALAVLILGLTVIGSQFRSSLAASWEMDRDYRAMLLAESRLAKLDTGLLLQGSQIEDEIEEDFDEDEDFHGLFPEYAWRMNFQPSAVDGLVHISLAILYDERRRDTKTEYDFDEAKEVQTVHTMRTVPVRIDPTRDFGMETALAEELAGALAQGGGTNIDLYNLDPGVLGKMNIEELLDVLPTLLQALGMSVEDVLAMLPPDLRAAVEAVQKAHPDTGADGGAPDVSDTGGGATPPPPPDAEPGVAPEDAGGAVPSGERGPRSGRGAGARPGRDNAPGRNSRDGQREGREPRNGQAPPPDDGASAPGDGTKGGGSGSRGGRRNPPGGGGDRGGRNP